jgi:hypothetical protein
MRIDCNGVGEEEKRMGWVGFGNIYCQSGSQVSDILAVNINLTTY